MTHTCKRERKGEGKYTINWRAGFCFLKAAASICRRLKQNIQINSVMGKNGGA
jgi:hypothetical protein